MSKTELLDNVWGDRFVTESALTSRVKAARRAVGDDAKDPHVISTVRGRGYRFVAPLTSTLRPPPASSTPGSIPAVDLLERDEALGILNRALDNATQGGGRVVLDAGEPGIGKTALVRAFAVQVSQRARVLWGGCDDLITPRPFAPLHDLAEATAELAGALAAGAPSTTVHRLVLAELDLPPGPTVLVVEDAHWADEATPDLVTFLVRRMTHVHGVLVLTYRDTELGDAHPLLPVIGAVPSPVARDVTPAPLSFHAVATLVGDDRADEVMAATKGNPFYVTELAATDTEAVPSSVRHAVLARVARLPEPTRELLAVLAVEPARVEFDVLDQVRPDWGDTIVAAERGGIVVVGDSSVQFRHELARRSVLDAVPGARRRRLHLDLLRELIDRAADPARIVHHAAAAADTATLATFSLRAARQAAAVSAHREAHSQYRRALTFLGRLTTEERARIHEEASREAYLNAAETEALDDARAALAGFEQLGDRLGAGRLHRWLSRLHWFACRRAEADAAGRRAVEVLEPLGPSTELAWAYSNLSQLAMLAANNEEATLWGSRAIALAERLGDDAVRAHALVNIALARTKLGIEPDSERPLLEAVAVADAAGEHHEATRGLLGLAYEHMLNNRLERAAEIGNRALTYADEHEVHALSHYIVAMLARVDVLAGRWSRAETPLREVLAEGGLVARLLALSALALLQVRRGDSEAGATLTQAWEHAIAADELQRLAPVAALEAERAWLAGKLRPESPHLRSCYEQAIQNDPDAVGELARWLHEAGGLTDVAEEIGEPYRFEVSRQWEAAASAWAERGMPYDRALCLARSEHGLAEALAIADSLGAAPLAAWIRRRLADTGAR